MKPLLFQTWLGLYANQLTHGLKEFSVVCLFINQLGAVFLVPSAYPIWVVQVFLDVMIGFNGNYGFFNLLTVALCFLLLDDSVF